MLYVCLPDICNYPIRYPLFLDRDIILYCDRKVNNKINEYSKIDSFRRRPMDTQSVLLQLNIADDYFKAKKQIVILEEEIQTKEKELYNLKHELIASQIKLENSEKNIKSLQHELNESSKKIIRLETELKN